MSQEPSLTRILYLGGPTAVGKSRLALHLAQALNAELINADSVQLYRGLDIGSAKPSLEERQRVPHHLIDVLDPNEDNNAAEFAQLADEAIKDIRARGKQAIVVGGTGLYLRILVHGIFEAPPADEAIRAEHARILEEHGASFLHARLQEIDPRLAERVHANDFVRVSRGLEVYEQTGKPLSEHQEEHAFATPRYDALKLALWRPRKELYERVNLRVEQMIEQGLIEEVRGLIEAGYGPELKPMQSLGYRQVCQHLAGELSAQECVELIQRDTRRYAKRQLSWLRAEQGVVWAKAPLVDEQGRAPQEVLEDLRAFLEQGRREELRWAQDSFEG